MSNSGIFKFDDEKYRYIPGPLFAIVKEFYIEKNHFKKVHRLINTFEWIYKWHAVLTVSDLLRGSGVSEDMKVFLSRVLRTPSMGNWYLVFKFAVEEMRASSIEWGKLEVLRTNESRHNIVNFRNKYAHGAIPDDEECILDCEKYSPVLLAILDSQMMKDLRLLVGHSGSTIMLLGPDEIPVEMDVASRHAAVLLPDVQVLDIWPLGVYKEDPRGIKGNGFYFFNSIRQNQKAIEQLSYELPSLNRDRDFWRPFLGVFPLKDWGRLPGGDFDQFRSSIEQLTENFKGRESELEEIKNFMLNGRGTFMVWGGPGIGKSALVAQALKDVRARSSEINSSHDCIIIEYFIFRSDFTARCDTFLNYINGKLDTHFKIKGVVRGIDELEMREMLERRLNIIEDNNDGNDLLLIIDGLDECPEIRKYIPKSRNWLKILILSREVAEIKDWWRTHDRENRRDKNLKKLSDKEIVSILYDVVNKYQAGFNKKYVFEVCRRSEGNPLYLKLLCDQIYEDGGMVESVDKIPESWADLYASTLKRVSQQQGGGVGLNILRILAVAKDALSVNMIRFVLNENNKIPVDIQDVINGVDLCRELLFEEEDEQHIEKYRLFHESLRVWVLNNYEYEVSIISNNISNFCFEWDKKSDYEAKKYCFKFAVRHLHDIEDEEKIWALLSKSEYLDKQIIFFNSTQESIISLKLAISVFLEFDKNFSNLKLCYLSIKLAKIYKYSHNIVVEKLKNYLKCENIVLDDLKKVVESLSVLSESDYLYAIMFVFGSECGLLNKRKNIFIENILYVLGDIAQKNKYLKNLRMPLEYNYVSKIANRTIILLGESDNSQLIDFVFIFENQDFFRDFIVGFFESNNKLCLEFVFHVFGRLDDSKGVLSMLIAYLLSSDCQPVKNNIITNADAILNLIVKIDCYLKKNELLAKVIEMLCEASAFDKALNFLSFIDDFDTKNKAVLDIIYYMNSVGLYNDALGVSKDYNILTASDEYLTSTSLGFSKCGSFEAAVEIVSKIEDYSLKHETCLSIIQDMYLVGLEESEIQRVRERFKCYDNDLMNRAFVACENKDFLNSLCIIAQVDSCSDKLMILERVCNSIIECNDVIDKHVFDAALDMHELLFGPNKLTLSLVDIAVGMVLSGHDDDGRKYINKIIKNFLKYENNFSFIDIYVRLAYADSLVGNECDVQGVLIHLRSVFKCVDRFDESWLIFFQYKKLLVKIDDERKIIFLNHIYELVLLERDDIWRNSKLYDIIESFLCYKLFKKDLKYIELLEYDDLRRRAYCRLLFCIMESRESLSSDIVNVFILRDLFYQKNNKLVISGCVQLMNSLLDKGYVDQSLEIFNKFFLKTKSEPNESRKYSTFNSFIGYVVNLSYSQHAKSEYVYDDFLNTILELHNQYSDLLIKNLLLHHVRNNLCNIDNFLHNVDLISDINLVIDVLFEFALYYFRDGNIKKSLYYFNRVMNIKDTLPHQYGRDIVQGKVVVELSRNGFLQESNKYFVLSLNINDSECLLSKSINFEPLFHIVNGLRSSGLVEEAFLLIHNSCEFLSFYYDIYYNLPEERDYADSVRFKICSESIFNGLLWISLSLDLVCDELCKNHYFYKLISFYNNYNFKDMFEFLLYERFNTFIIESGLFFKFIDFVDDENLNKSLRLEYCYHVSKGSLDEFHRKYVIDTCCVFMSDIMSYIKSNPENMDFVPIFVKVVDTLFGAGLSNNLYSQIDDVFDHVPKYVVADVLTHVFSDVSADKLDFFVVKNILSRANFDYSLMFNGMCFYLSKLIYDDLYHDAKHLADELNFLEFKI